MKKLPHTKPHTSWRWSRTTSCSSHVHAVTNPTRCNHTPTSALKSGSIWKLFRSNSYLAFRGRNQGGPLQGHLHNSPSLNKKLKGLRSCHGRHRRLGRQCILPEASMDASFNIHESSCALCGVAWSKGCGKGGSTEIRMAITESSRHYRIGCDLQEIWKQCIGTHWKQWRS